MDTATLIGLGASAATWFLWASAVILFRKAGDELSPLELNLGKNLVGFMLFSATLPFLGIRPWDVPADALRDLTLSGVLGIALGDLLFMASLVMLGASLNAIVGSTYTPTLIITSILFLGEKPGPGIWIGGLMVVSAIVMASWSKDSLGGRPSSVIWIGVGYELAAVLSMAGGIVLMKEYLPVYPTPLVNWIRMGTGTVALLTYLLVRNRGSLGFLRFFRASHFMRYLLPGSVLGAFLAIWTWTVSLEYLPASLVGVLGQVTTFAIILFAAVFLGESMTLRKVVAAVLAVTGSTIAILWR